MEFYLKNRISLIITLLIGLVISGYSFSVSNEILELDGNSPDRVLENLLSDRMELNVETLIRAGWIEHYYLGNDNKALEYFERAISIDNTAVYAHEGLGIIDFMKGDMAGALQHWFSISKFNPASLEGIAYASHLNLFRGTTPDYELLVDEFYKISQTAGLKGWFQYRYKMLEEYYRFIMDAEPLEEKNEIWDLVDTFKVIGPFVENGRVDFNNVFPPQKNLDKESYEFKEKTYKWFDAVASEDGYLYISDIFPEENAVIYIKANYFASEERETYLVISSHYPLKLFLNGEELYSSNSYKKPAPDIHTIPVKINKGKNIILIKTMRNFGQYRENIEWGLLVQIIKNKKDMALYNDIVNIQPGYTENEIIGGFKGIYHSLLYLYDGNEEEAIDTLEYVVEQYPDYPFFRIILTYAYLWVNDDWMLKKARSELSTIIDMKPDCVIAQEELAVFLHSEENYNKAIDVYKSTIENRDDYVSAYLGLAETYWYKGYISEFLDELNKVNNIYPDNPRLLRLYGDYYYNNDIYEKALGYYLRFIEIRRGNLSIREDIAYCYEQLGDFKSAINTYREIQRLRPEYMFYSLEIARLLERNGEIEKAKSIYSELISKRPWWDKPYQRLGMLYLLRDNNLEEGLVYFKKARDLQPNNYWLEKFLRVNFKNKNALFEKFDQNFGVDEIKPLETYKYPGANSIMLYDQMIIEVNNDYSFSEVVHNLIQIVNQKGREDWGEITIPSSESVDILEARTILPDGTILDASSIKDIDGNYVISMEGLIPNSIIEIKYRLQIDLRVINDLDYFFSPQFMFSEIHIPFIKSQFVIIAPDDIELGFVKERFKGETLKINENGYTAYSFVMTDIEPIYSEVSMPPIHQISPVVYASTFDGVEQLFEWYRGEIWGLSRLSYSNRKEIIQLIKEESEDVSNKLSLAKNAYYWVMANIQGNIGNIYYPSDVNDTFVTRRGRPIDRAILLMSIFKEMGVSSELVLLNTTDESDDIWKYPTSSVVDMALVHILDLDGEEYFLDVNIKDLAFGDYWSDCYDKRCVFINENGFESGRVPSKPTEENFVALTGIMKINGKGEMVMEGSREFCGLRSSYRTVFKDPKDREPLVESSLARSFSTITLTEITFNNVENKDEPFSYDFRFISPYYGRISGDSVIIPSTPGRFNMTSAFIFSDKRKYPLHLNRYELYKDSIGIEIPDEYYFDYIPDDISIEEDFGEYRLEYSMMGDVLKVDRYLYLKDKTIDVDEYDDFVRFCDDIDKAEKMEIRISKK